MALYAISKLMTEDESVGYIRYAFALPYDGNHISIIEDIRKVLNILNITVFWVKETGEIIEQQY